MYFNFGSSTSSSSYQNAANGSCYQNASNGASYQNATNGASYQNSTNGSNYQNTSHGSSYQNTTNGASYQNSTNRSNYQNTSHESSYQNTSHGSNYQNASNGSNYQNASNGSWYQNPTNGSCYQNTTNGSCHQTASRFPTNMSTSQMSGVYPGCGSTQRYPVGLLPVDAVDAYNTAVMHLPADQDRRAGSYDTRSYGNNFDSNQSNDVMNYSSGTKVNDVSNNYSTVNAAYGYDNLNCSTTSDSYGGNLVTSQCRSKLPMSCWTNEELLAAANLTNAEAEELLASVDAELAAKRKAEEAAGQTSASSNLSKDNSTTGFQHFGSGMQQPASTINHVNSFNQLAYDRRVSLQMDIKYLPSSQFSNQPNNRDNWTVSNRQIQSQRNEDIRTQSEHKMMLGYQYKGQHHRQKRTTTVNNTDRILLSNSSKQSSPESYDFSHGFDHGVSNFNFSQAIGQGASNYVSSPECYQDVSNQIAYPTGLQSCNEAMQPLNNWTPASISNTHTQQRQGSNSANISIVHQGATQATSRKITSTARDAMIAWFEENKHHPYPDPDEYKSFVAVGGTTYSQAVKWFANRRKRTGTCKTIPEYVQGRRVKPAKPNGQENVVPVNVVNRKRSSDADNVVGQPNVKKSRKM